MPARPVVIKKLSAFAADPESQNAFLAIKRENKKKLIDFLENNNPIRDQKGKILGFTKALTEDALLVYNKVKFQ